MSFPAGRSLLSLSESVALHYVVALTSLALEGCYPASEPPLPHTHTAWTRPQHNRANKKRDHIALQLTH